MADPFSIIGLLAVAMNGIDRVTNLIDGISGAPRAIQKLDNELKDISRLLHQVNSFVHQIHAADSSAQDSFIPHLQTALANCKEVTAEVETLLRPYSKSTLWRRLTWTRKEQKIAGLERDMAKCKQMLNMAISFADLTVNARSSRRVLKIERGVKQIQMNLGIDNVSVVDSDYAGSVDTSDRRNIMTSQWIMQTDTVVEETFDEMQEEHYEISHEEDIVLNAPAGQPPIKRRVSPPPIEKVVEPIKETPKWSQTTQVFSAINTTQTPAPTTQPPSIQRVVEPTKEIPKWSRRMQFFKTANTTQTPAPVTQRPAPPPTPENGQLIRKTKVSRNALQYMGMKYSEEGIYVRLPERIDAATLQHLRITSSRLGGMNSKLWWTDPPSKPRVVSRSSEPGPAPPQIAPPSRVAPSSNAQTNGRYVAQMLRKTIVSRAALQQMGIPYSEDATHVFLPQKLEGPMVQMLRDLSRNMEGNSRYWWT